MVGKIAISLEVWSLTRGRNSLRNAKDSLGVLYIFQLAAISGFLMCESVFHFVGVLGSQCGRESAPWLYCGANDERETAAYKKRQREKRTACLLYLFSIFGKR